VRVGLTLPQFRDQADDAIATAIAAESVGIDGVFVFDHLWPIGRPDRPAIPSQVLLGALAVETSRVVIGTLVSRVSLFPNAVLAHAIATAARMAGPRFVAGLGTGDSLNRAENEAYGVPFDAAAERLADLEDCCRRLVAEGVPTWAGGLSPMVRRIAAEVANGWNGWALSTTDWVLAASEVRAFAAEAGRAGEVECTWGGQVLVARTQREVDEKRQRLGDRTHLVAATVDGLAGHLRRLAGDGCTFAVCAPVDVGDDPDVPAMVADAADMASA
jgi:alkanesulfonate monooxygenase SsuD/methylene tetrahydromethanopterin reductase-like flavin-dependent oxidoreductase (luciferase family)